MRLKIHIVLWLLLPASVSCGNREAGKAIIIENGSYFDGTGFVPFGELVINSDTITSINKGRTLTAGERIDVSGKYIIPGMTDAHVHLAGAPTRNYVFLPHYENAKSSLLCGVTTVIDLFFQETKCAAFRKTLSLRPAEFCRTLLSGPIITAPGGHGTEYGVPTRTITTVPEAVITTNEVINSGVDVIKVVYEAHSSRKTITKEMLAAMITTAHKRGRKVFVHINAAAEAMDCIDVKADVLAHLPMNKFTQSQMFRLKMSGIIIIPTMSVMVSMFEGPGRTYLSDPLLWKTAQAEYMKHFDSVLVPEAPYFSKRYSENVWHNMKQCVAYGIPVLAGTDAGNFAVFYGYSLHWEMAYYVKAGMSPAQALNTATRNITALFPELKTGALKPGYYADIVVLNKNPLENIHNTRSIYSVYHRGRKVKNKTE